MITRLFLLGFLLLNIGCSNTNVDKSYIRKIDDVFIILLSVLGVFIIVSFFVAFCKVPLIKGYKCRCGERTKWFFKAFCYQIFFIFLIVQYILKALFKCLDVMCPDTKLEDNKINDQTQQQSIQFNTFKEEEERK